MVMTKTGRFNLRWRLFLIILPIVTAVIALGIGRYMISPAEVLEAIAGRFTGNYEISDMAYKTVWNLRIPRILLALLVGAGLSTAGCAFQSLFANPLATPDTLGVASGSSFGAALGILLGFDMLGMQLTSFVMGALAVSLTWLGGSGKGRGLSSVGAYRLDLVAVCGGRSVAIECDGERWHSGESKIREDMERQTILERLGWQFIRIRGSEYYRDPGKCMNRVCRELEDRGILAETREVEQKPDTDLLSRVKAHAEQLLEPAETNREQIIRTALDTGKEPIAEAPKDLILEYLKKRDIPYHDMREKGGALWIIGGSELKTLISQCEALGLHFRFQKGGTKLTKWQDAWWAK